MDMSNKCDVCQHKEVCRFSDMLGCFEKDMGQAIHNYNADVKKEIFQVDVCCAEFKETVINRNCEPVKTSWQ